MSQCQGCQKGGLIFVEEELDLGFKRVTIWCYLNKRSLADISVLGLLQAELNLVYDDNGDASINPRYGASWSQVSLMACGMGRWFNGHFESLVCAVHLHFHPCRFKMHTRSSCWPGWWNLSLDGKPRLFVAKSELKPSQGLLVKTWS